MAEYIEREALTEDCKRMIDEIWNSKTAPVSWSHAYAEFFDNVERAPAADVAPVVHGYFVHDGPRFAGGVDWWHCSNCGRLTAGVETRFAYCPSCGARMSGERKNNE